MGQRGNAGKLMLAGGFHKETPLESTKALIVRRDGLSVERAPSKIRKRAMRIRES